MDIASLGGWIGGIAAVIIGIMIGGNPLSLYVDIPSLFVVVVGSFCAIVASSPLSRITSMGKIFGKFMNQQSINSEVVITQLVGYAETARKEGLLSLDDAVNEIEDSFMRSGMRLVVDGTDPEIVKKVLMVEINQTEARHKSGIGLFSSWGSIAPAFGMIGTLLGLIGMMSNLDDIAAVGPNMAVALVTTLYGSFFANLFFIPLANKLEDRNGDEMVVREIMLEGMLSIQAGDNPKILEQKLYSFLSPSERPANLGME